MPGENANDKVMLSIHTAVSGTWQLSVSRAEALQASEDWQSEVGDLFTVSGKIIKSEGTHVQVLLRKDVVTAISIAERKQGS